MRDRAQSLKTSAISLQVFPATGRKMVVKVIIETKAVGERRPREICGKVEGYTGLVQRRREG